MAGSPRSRHSRGGLRNIGRRRMRDQWRARAQRIDNQVERPLAPVLIQNDGSPVEVLDLTPRLNFDARRLNGLEQNIEQGRPVNRQPPCRAQSLVTHIKHHPARAAGLAIEPVDARTQGPHASAEPQLVENGKPGGLQDEAGAQRLRLLELFENGNPVAMARKRQRRRKPRRPRSAHGNMKARTHSEGL